MSSWVALKERAEFLAGETVLVNGATGASGRLALQVAKYLGAKKVIATGRQAAALESIKDLGADETILLVENKDALENTFIEQFAGGVDVVLDYPPPDVVRGFVVQMLFGLLPGAFATAIPDWREDANPAARLARSRPRARWRKSFLG